MNSLLTPEPSIQDINENQHDYAAPARDPFSQKLVRDLQSARERAPPPLNTKKGT